MSFALGFELGYETGKEELKAAVEGYEDEITRLKAKVDALTDGLDEVRRFLADPLDPDDVICARDEADRVLRAVITQEKTDV
jgi:hypothetical protein